TTCEQLTAYEEVHFPAVRLAVEPQLARHWSLVRPADELKESFRGTYRTLRWRRKRTVADEFRARMRWVRRVAGWARGAWPDAIVVRQGKFWMCFADPPGTAAARTRHARILADRLTAGVTVTQSVRVSRGGNPWRAARWRRKRTYMSSPPRE